MRLKDKTLGANTGLDAIKRASIVEHDTGLKCIRIQDISQGKSYDEWGFTETNEKDRKKFLLKKNDLLIARTGATVGVSQFIKEDIEAVYNNGTIRLRLDKSLNPRFVYYIFQTKSFLQYIDNISCVATQPNLRIEGLLRFTIPDYSIERQNEIVKTLSTFDNLIENNNKRIRLLEQMAENLYKEWFVRFRFPGYEDVEFENGIPKGWEYCKLINFIDVRYGKDHKSIEEGTIPILGSGGIMRYGDRALYNGEAVLIPRKGSLNNIMYINGEFWTVDTLFYSIPKIKNIARYLYFTFKYINMESLNSGASIPSMTTDIIYHLKMRQPDATVLEKFDEVLKPIYEEIDLLGKRNDNIKKQRDMLLPRLMSGKLEV